MGAHVKHRINRCPVYRGTSSFTFFFKHLSRLSREISLISHVAQDTIAAKRVFGSRQAKNSITTTRRYLRSGYTSMQFHIWKVSLTPSPFTRPVLNSRCLSFLNKFNFVQINNVPSTYLHRRFSDTCQLCKLRIHFTIYLLSQIIVAQFTC